MFKNIYAFSRRFIAYGSWVNQIVFSKVAAFLPITERAIPNYRRLDSGLEPN